MSKHQRLIVAMRALHWGTNAVIAETCDNERTVRRWISGQNETPEEIVEWLETLVRVVAAHPAPGRGR